MNALILRGNVHTGDPSQPRAEAVLVREGRVEAVGDARALRRLAPRADALDAGGGAILPGLVDGHGHILSLGLSLSAVHLEAARSMDDVVAACRAASHEEWIQGRGWDQTTWTNGDCLPDAAALDAAFPDRPVFLVRVDGHAALANSCALRAAGVGVATPDPPGGRFSRRRDGRPDGLLLDAAMDRVRAAIPPPTEQQLEAALEAAARHLVARGLTAVHDAGLDEPTHRALVRMAGSGRLPLRVFGMIDLLGPAGATWLDSASPIRGSVYSLDTVKLFADGALGSRGAQLFEAYDDDPGNTGIALQDDGTLHDLAVRAVRRGFRLAVHAIGDRANARVLDLLERLRDEGIALDRARVEHAQVVRPADVARFRALGAVASMQPVHATSDRRHAGRRLGAARLAGAYAWRTFRDAGVPLCFGSDFPVEDADPRLGLHAAITRTDAGCQPSGGWRAEQCLPAQDALHAFTAGCAHAVHAEHELGCISPGFAADFTVLGTDPLTDGTPWPDAPIRAVFVAGQQRF